ncbi:hypothetical protein FIM08_03885 [SAR202 cluster bacterium AC-647-N09_OGT_505m]|nr:hypothetical protein [SAR202 cluster bacterium AC-647-N09_OGT_505m]
MSQVRGSTRPDYLIWTALECIIFVGLHHSGPSCEGQFIDLSMCETVTAVIPQAILDYQISGRVRSPQSNREPLAVLHNVYRCAGENQKALC